MFQADEPFSVNSRRRGDAVVVDLEGAFVLGPALAAFRTQTRTALQGVAPSLMVLNLGRVLRVDSSGLGELFLLHSLATKVGAKLVLAATPARVLDLLVMTRMDGIFPTFADERAAIGAKAAAGNA